MDFRISGLPRADFAALFGMSDAELSARSAVRLYADRSPGFPCRVSLRDAEPGASVLLVNYEHLAVASPYRSRYAIYVRENAREMRPEPNEIPPVLQGRLLSLRAFDADGMLRAAEVAQEQEFSATIRRLLGPPHVAYLHVHNAKPGCYAARVDRA